MQSCLQGCQEGLWLVAAVRAAVSCWLLLWGWLWWWPLCRRGFWRWRSRRRSYHRCVSCTGCSGWRDNSCRHGQAQAQARVGQAVGWHGYAGTVEGALPCSCVGKRVWKAEAPGRWDVTRRVPGPGCGRRAAGVTAEEAAAQADLARKGGLSPCSDVSWYGGDACSSAARRCAPRLCGSNGCQLTSTSRRRRRCSIPSDSYSFPGVAVNPLHACQAPERQAQRRLRPQPEGQENAQPPPHQARG